MSALLKSGGTVPVRAFGAPIPVTDTPVLVAMSDPRDDAIASLQAEVERLERALTASEAGTRAAVEVAHGKGRDEGLALAEDRAAERLAALDAAMRGAAAAFEERLGTLDRLAPALVRAALDRVLDAPDAVAELATGMVARNLRALRRDSIVTIRVSAADFADAAALATLRAAWSSVDVQTDPDVPSGGCRITCTMGGLDLDLGEQWGSVAAALDTLAARGDDR